MRTRFLIALGMGWVLALGYMGWEMVRLPKALQ